MIRSVSLALFLVLFISLAEAQDRWDWHISGGMIIDGTGKPAYRADILIRGDTIGFIGPVNPDTIVVRYFVDAYRKKVSPGFVDIHAHGDPRSTPEFHNFLAMGVTTILLGQDGSSPGEGQLASWFEQVEDVGPAVNIAALSGHGNLRTWAGAGSGNATEQEIDRMEALLSLDMEAGAWGMSTGLEYVPGLYAGQEEMLRLADVVGSHDGIIVSHMRSEDDSDLEKALDELASQGQYTHVHASHLKSVYGQGAERAEEILRYIDTYRKQGIEFSADTYPYAASYTGLAILFPSWAKTNEQWHQAMNERPGELRNYLLNRVKRRNGPKAILFGSGRYTGQTLKEVSDQEERPYVEILLEIGPQAASAAHFVMDEELQDRIAIDSKVMISSDGSPGMRHPRGYGSFARIIHRYVREQRTLTLEEAVYKMSGLPAATLGLVKRGIIKEGFKADLLVFDPGNVRDLATFEQPHKLAEGFDWIWVNGHAVRKGNQFVKNRFGEVLRRGQP